MKKLLALILALLMLCSCGIQEEPAENKLQTEAGSFVPETTKKEEPQKLFKPEVEELMEILWTFEKPSEAITGKGYTFYGRSECSGYENFLSFAENHTENTEETFYIGTFGTTWKLIGFSYSEKEEQWLCTEYWIDTFYNNKRIEKTLAASEIKIYENRISVYFENDEKIVIYEKGSELGLPVNNCSHSPDAHYIENSMINFINSEELKARYEDTHSEPYLNFDELTKSLYDEEEKCLINIYYYVDYYGITYDDFLKIYGSEENILKMWPEADIKVYFEK